MASRLQWPHPEFVRQREALPIMLFRLLKGGRPALHADVAEEPERPRLLASLLIGQRKFERSLGDLYCAIQVAIRQEGLAQPEGPLRVLHHSSHGGGVLDSRLK